jgi:hypothetical protein
MAQRGGPWRLAAYAIPDASVTRGRGATGKFAAREGDRVLRWIVVAYVLGIVGGGLVALVGLSKGWW